MKPSPEALAEALTDCEALVTRSSTAVTAGLLDRAPRLRIIGRAGVGVDNIDVDACSRRGVVVVNAPHGNVVSAAEHTVGMLLALVRRIPDAHARLKALEWDRSIYGAELHRKTLGVVGLGKVGLRVAARLRGFEPARLLVYDPYIPEARARDVGARLVPDFDALLREADVVTFHVPLTPETEGMAGARELALLRPGARVVNCARGGIVVEADLLAALESGHVAGGALDEHAVNIPVADATTVEELRPFVALAEVLGRFCVQLDPEHLARVEVTVAGAIAETDPELLARGVLAGLLDPVTAGPVNLVNAHLVARERGVEVEIHRTESTGAYKSMLTVCTQTAEGKKLIAGTVFDGQPRIVQLRDLHIEFTPEGYILVLSYEDRPGMVGRIGSILGRLNVNIASMHVGRKTKRGRAIVVLLLDEDLAPEQVTEVARAVEADFARLIRLR